MDNLINCIIDTIHQKGKSMETFILEKNTEKLYRLPNTGLNGIPVYPEDKTITITGEDSYVPSVKDSLMLAESYLDNKTKKPIKLSERMLKEYSINQPPIGWYMSEKFDGQRALWDGSKFISRGSRVYPYVPVWFIALMPPGIALDGEFFTERSSFQDLGFLRSKIKDISLRKKNDHTILELDKKWINIKYQVFDLISDDVFEKRLIGLKKIIKLRCSVWNDIELPMYLVKNNCPLVYTEQLLIKSEDDLNNYYLTLKSDLAEGVMIRAPGIKYIPRRSKLILKLKPEEDAECVIVGYKLGEGKYENLLGSFKCKTPEDNIFYVGGMSDEIRNNYKRTHPVGTVITYKYTFLTDSGIPRHPRYFRIYNI